jgi:hypothetical protein
MVKAVHPHAAAVAAAAAAAEMQGSLWLGLKMGTHAGVHFLWNAWTSWNGWQVLRQQ